MKSIAALLFGVLSCAGVCSATSEGSPVEKIVKLLVDMKEKLGHDGADEKAVYENYVCWCTSMTSQKGKAIEDAKTELESLGSDIITLSGKVATLSSEIDEAAKEMKETHTEQQEASEQHEKEVVSFTALRAEMDQAIQSLQQALKMLKLSPTFLQTGQGLSTATAEAVRSAINAIPDKALGSLPAAKLSQIQSITSAVAQGKYNPSYGSIVGILEELYKTFDGDLKKETETHNTSMKDFEEMMQLKMDRLDELKAKIDKKMSEKATAAKDMADKTQNYDDTNEQMEADITFFQDTVTSCKEKAGVWKIRKEMRTEELAGIDEAIKILSSDDARELFNKAINAGSRVSFLQVEATPASMSPGQAQAFKLLKSFAKTSSNSMTLARIAAKVRLAQGGHFNEVMKAIDDVIAVLKTEQEDDDKKKTQCNEEYHNVAKTVADLKWKIEKNIAKIDKLETTISEKEEEKVQTVEAIKDVTKQLKDMKDLRKKEKDAYDEAKKDDEDAIVLLKQAKDAMQAFYKKHNLNDALAAFIQGDPIIDGLARMHQEPTFDRGDKAPDAEFSDKGSRTTQAKGITLLFENIIEGIEAEITTQDKVEKDAIASYEKAKKAAEDLKATLETKRDNLTQEIADRKKDKDDEEKDKEANEGDLKQEEDYKAEITPDCDFIIKNWQSRATKRQAEMDGLGGAKDYLAGAMKNNGAVKAAVLATQKTRLRQVAPH